MKDIRETLLGKRLANVYDLSERTYLFKFAGQKSTEKAMLLLESGIRFHLTQYVRNIPDVPSPFAMKLRRHIRTYRLEGVNQLGYDRVVDLKFRYNETVNHIILELYAGGNIVLTDGNYEVMALLRSHQFSEDVVLKVGEIYPVAFTTNLATQLDTSMVAGPFHNPESFRNWIELKKVAQVDSNTDSKEPGKEKKKAKALNLKQVLLNKDSGVSHLGPEIIEHCLLECGFKQNAKLDFVKQLTDEQLSVFLSTFREKGMRVLDSLDNNNTTATTTTTTTTTSSSAGYIIFEKNNGSNYSEFTPTSEKKE